MSTNEVPLDEGQDCLAVDVILSIIYTGEDTSGLLGRLRNAFIDLCPEIHDLPGIVDTFDPCPYILISEGVNGGVVSEQDDNSGTDNNEAGGGAAAGGDDVAAVATDSDNTNQNGISTPAVLIVAGAGLALLLLLILAARRHRRDVAPLQHKALEDDGPDDDETYLRDIDAASDDSRAWDTRLAHVVGEDNSVVSDWTGYTNHLETLRQKRRSERALGLKEHGDVHQCSSATCEMCETRRQAGIKAGLQFVPTSSMSIHEVGSRDYAHDDTVDM